VLSTEKLARAAAAHPWRTLAAWAAAIAVAIVLVGAFLGGGLTSEAAVTNDADSLRANELISERMPPPDFVPDELVVVRSDEHTVDDPAFRARLEELTEAASATGAIAQARTPLQDQTLISADRHAALFLLELRPDPEERIESIVQLVEREDGREGFEVAITGDATLDHDFGELSERDLQNGELRFGLPAALIVLVIVFGALVASALPLVLALVSIAVALGLTALVTTQWELSLFVVNMLTGMGLALGIDYALFVVSRFREERASGREKVDAIAAAGATASRAVLFSGSAFVLAMTGLLLVQSTIMRSLATGAILVGIVSVVAALTLLPAVLSLLGDRVNRLHVPVIGRHVADRQGVESRLWGGIVRRVLRRPALSFALATAALLVAAAPLVMMDIGAAGITTLPDDTVSKRGFLALERSFPSAGSDPVRIVVSGDLGSAEVRDAVDRLQARLADDPDFGAAELTTNPDEDLGVLTVQVAGDPLGDRAVAAVRELRSDTIPAALDGVAAEALVTGATAENVDYFDVMTTWLPIVIVFVLGLSFLLLTVAFRSLAIPATAIVLNLLSVGATYGLVVAVFQHGFLNELLGFRQVDTIEAWVPLFLFAVLFGLSMDYQVFLLSRIRERYSQSGDTLDAVRFGVGSTGRIITGAALIIVAVFAGFAAGDLVMFQQMGFGIAAALLIDATIVRSVLVPAAMALFGERNWWLPGWLGWLPHVEVEGHAERVVGVRNADIPGIAAHPQERS
jgi:putative drug exporter of the RND superfamily